MKAGGPIIIVALCLLTAGQVAGALRYWDSNGTTPGAGDTPTGTWGANAFWSTSTNGDVATTAWAVNDTAVFSAGTDATNPFTVFVTGSQLVRGITFEEGTTTLSGGNIVLAATAVPIIANVDATLDSVLSLNGLTKSGPGTLTLTRSNTFSGLTTVQSGILTISHNAALGTAAAGTIVSNGASLLISNGIAVTDQITLYGDGVAGTGALRNLSGSNWVETLQMDLSPDQEGLITSEAGVLGLGRLNAGSKFTLVFNGNGDVVVGSGQATHGLYWGGILGGLTKLGSGTLTLNGFVPIRSVITVQPESTLKMGAAYRFGNPDNRYPVFKLWGVWDLNGFSQIIDTLYGYGSIINSGSCTLILGTNGNYHPYSTSTPLFFGSVSGNTTIKKIGTNTQILAGLLTHSGETLVEEGTLKLETSSSNSPLIRVAGGAKLLTSSMNPLMLRGHQTLMGGGTVAGSVTVSPGGHISPGDGVGTMTFAPYGGLGLDLEAGGVVDWELATNSEGNPGTTFDQIVMSNTSLILGGESVLRLNFVGSATAPDLSEPFWQTNHSWHIISSTDMVSNFAEIENGRYAAGNFSTVIETNGIWLNYTPGDIAPPGPTSTNATWAVTQRRLLGSTDVVRILRDPLRPWLYLIDRQNSKVLFVNSQTMSIENELYVGNDPTDCDIDATGHLLYVANKGTGSPGSSGIAVVALTNQTLVTSYVTPMVAVHVTAGRPGRLYYNAGNEISNGGDGRSFNTDTATDLGSFGGVKTRMVISPDKTLLYGQFIYYGNLGEMGVFDVSSDQITLVDYYPYSPYPYGWDYDNYSLSGDGRLLAYGKILFNSTNLADHIGAFPEQVFDLNHNGSLAFGERTIWDTTTFPIQSNATQIATLPFSGKIMEFDRQANVLYAFRSINGSLYAIQPATAHGIPFRWLVEHGLGTNYVVEAQDPDNDGLNNLEEWVRDSDPTTPTPPPKLTWTSNHLLIVPDTSPARWYQLERIHDLTSRNWQTISKVPGTGSDVVFDVTADQGQGTNAFYRLRIKVY